MRRMKINSPASTVEGAIKAIDSGADEIYCGVKLEGMKYVTFNGRPGYGSLDNFEQLKQVTDYAHKKNAQVNFVLNLPFMTDILNVLAKPYIKKAVKADVDSFIVADVGFMLLLDKLKIKKPIHVGSFSTVRNNEAIEFYTQFNVKRIIAPPDTTIDELKLLSNNKHNIEIEAFVHGQGCSNVNGNCYLFHSYRPQKEEFPDDPLWSQQSDKSLVSIGIRNPCMFKYSVNELGSQVSKDEAILNAFPFCSLCYLEEIIETGAKVLKIEGRCQPIEYQDSTPKEYRKLLDFLEANDRESYKKYLQELKKNSPELQGICKSKKCYYKVGEEKCI